MINRLAVIVVSAVLACGCRATPASDSTVLADAGAAAASAQAVATAAASGQAKSAGLDYKISAADLVSVSVYDVPEMTRKVRVDANGVISLPLAGAVKIGGKSLGAAQRLIEKKLAAYVVEPHVTLFIEEYGNKMVFVMGEVQKPGSYPIPTESRMTVMQAISTAGGFTPIAAQDRARVLRFVNGGSMNFTVDVRSIVREGQKDKDILLQPNDVVFVPQSMF